MAGCSSSKDGRLVAEVLRESATQSIDFWLEGLHLHGQGFTQVANAIVEGKIGVALDSTNPLGGEYDDWENNIVLPSLKVDDRALKALIVHEAVHAYCDLAKARKTSALSEEVGAYIAQVLYFEYTGFTQTGRSAADVQLFSDVRKFCDQYDLARSRGAKLTRQQYESLRQTVLANPTYRTYNTKINYHNGIEKQ